eukprot:235959-Rhodomonas_salina.1
MGLSAVGQVVGPGGCVRVLRPQPALRAHMLPPRRRLQPPLHSQLGVKGRFLSCMCVACSASSLLSVPVFSSFSPSPSSRTSTTTTNKHSIKPNTLNNNNNNNNNNKPTSTIIQTDAGRVQDELGRGRHRARAPRRERTGQKRPRNRHNGQPAPRRVPGVRNGWRMRAQVCAAWADAYWQVIINAYPPDDDAPTFESEFSVSIYLGNGLSSVRRVDTVKDQFPGG